LQEAITKYAKSKGEYDSRLAALKELYKDKEGYTGEKCRCEDRAGAGG